MAVNKEALKQWLLDAQSGKQQRTLYLVDDRNDRDRVFIELSIIADEHNIPALFLRGRSQCQVDTGSVMYVYPVHLNIHKQTGGMWFTDIQNLGALEKFPDDEAVAGISAVLRGRVRAV